MEERTIYRTSQDVVCADPRKAQLLEDILAAIDRYMQGGEQKAAKTRSKAATGQNIMGSDSLEYIKRKQADLGLSGREIAKRAGISPGTISKIIQGKSKLTLATFNKISNALDAIAAEKGQQEEQAA